MEWFADIWAWICKSPWERSLLIAETIILMGGGIWSLLHRRSLKRDIREIKKDNRSLRDDNRLLMAALAEPDPDRRAAILGRVSAKPVAALWDVGRPVGEVRPTRIPPEDKS